MNKDFLIIETNNDDDSVIVSNFRGTIEEACTFTRFLVYRYLKNAADPDEIDFVSFSSPGNENWNNEAACIQLYDHHITYLVIERDDNGFDTIDAITEDAKEFISKYEKGIDDYEVEEFFEEMEK